MRVGNAIKRAHGHIALVAALVAPCAARASPGVAVAWDDTRAQRGVVQAMSSERPWSFVTPPIELGLDVRLRFAGGDVYAISRAEDTISAIDVESWTVARTYELGAESGLEDIAVVDADRAYVTRAAATHLLRLDLATGATEEVVDLSVFADLDGVPDLSMMAIFENLLFVQLGRKNSGNISIPPALLAVVDVTTEEIVDVDPVRPGVQAIRLAGTAPKMKMQVLHASRRLFVGATGDFGDDGGVEVIDLDTLKSRGIVLRELGPFNGPEIGAFVMARSASGYFVASTDLLSSSHLKGFTLADGADPTPDLETIVEYTIPALVHDPRSDTLFAPVVADNHHHFADGIVVLDAGTGMRLTPDTVRTGGRPTDLQLLCDDDACALPAGASFLRADSNADGQLDISDALFTLNYLFLGERTPPCRASNDSNADGKLDIADPVYSLDYLFRGGRLPPEPFPVCAEDPTRSDLDCRDYDACARTSIGA